ncbi:MAG: hypothetical protein JXP34_01835 [Planctomycetes bacterium]|nr:hypothetical protein [Planctomycetota bacterium]
MRCRSLLPLALSICAGAVPAWAATIVSVTRIPRPDGAGSVATAHISGDGRYVSFARTSSPRVAYVYDRETKEVTPAAKSTSGGTPDGSTVVHQLSYDGRFLILESTASDLVEGISPSYLSAYVYDRQAETAVLASATDDGQPADGPVYHLQLADDGQAAVFSVKAPNLCGGAVGMYQAVLRDLALGRTECVSCPDGMPPAIGGAYRPAISAGGRFVVFGADVPELLPGRTGFCSSDIFLLDRTTGERTCLTQTGPTAGGNANSDCPLVSADDGHVTFVSSATDLVEEPDLNWSAQDVFLWYRDDGSIARISRSTAGVQGSSHSAPRAISGDGRFVLFESWNNLAPDATVIGSCLKAYLWDDELQTCTLVSRSLEDDPGCACLVGWRACDMSRDGRFVVFESRGNGIVPEDQDGAADVFIVELDLTTQDVPFIRGDANGDGRIDIGDAISILGTLFSSRPSTCLDAIDADDSGDLVITDGIYILNYLYVEGPTPPAPFPEAGPDPTDDDLSCVAYP